MNNPPNKINQKNPNLTLSLNSLDNTINSSEKETQRQDVSKSFQSKMALEQSMAELRNFIDVVGPCETINSNKINQILSYRPKNLPKKSKEEEEYHRRLVEENKKLYLESIKQKQLKEQKIKEKQKLKKEKMNYYNKIWLNELIPNWIEIRKKDSTKFYFYEGLPDNLRGKIWLMCLGNRFSITKEYYEIEVKKAIDLLLEIQKKKTELSKINNNNENDKENNNIKLTKEEKEKFDRENSINIIDLDIERTFPYLNIFTHNSPLSDDLREILRAFVVSRPDIGYVQGLSFIAGMLILNMDKYKAFISMMNLILDPAILPFYKFDQKRIKTRLLLFKHIFYFNLPELCDYFDFIQIQPEHYFLNWNMTLFSHCVHIDIAMRIWDVYMIDGLKSIYAAAIVFLSHFEKKFLNMDFSEILNQINSIKLINFDEDTIIQGMKNVKFPDWIELEIIKLNEESIPL